MDPLEGIEADDWTVIKFRRQIPSCEPQHDLPITVSIFSSLELDNSRWKLNTDIPTTKQTL